MMMIRMRETPGRGGVIGALVDRVRSVTVGGQKGQFNNRMSLQEGLV